MNQVLPEQWF